MYYLSLTLDSPLDPPGVPGLKGRFSVCLSYLSTKMCLLKAMFPLVVPSILKQADPHKSHLKANIPPETQPKSLEALKA